MEGKEIVTKMRERGVALKSWAFDNKQWCRVSIGTADEMQMFLDAMKEINA
jgi:histidinol-phosphate aminotransferase